jgi:sulfatase modifying factor 1
MRIEITALLLLQLLSTSSIADPTSSAPAPPPGMVLVPAGVLHRGTSIGPVDQRPAHAVAVAPFFMHDTLVTVAAFANYVDISGAVTSAERAGFGKTATLGMQDWQWAEVEGATWRAPFGPAHVDDMPQRDDDPVTMVSFNDAAAYCAFYNLRLPTEIEWEYAMRAGSTARFPWGKSERDNDNAVRFNHWEGEHHDDNPAVDGFIYRSPVKAYPPNAFGLYDAVGNLWQWTADWYAPDTYARVAAAGTSADVVIAGDVAQARVPTAGTTKVARGGSWWCSANTCHGYGLVTRGKTVPQAAFSNNGFRCVQSITATPLTSTPPPR